MHNRAVSTSTRCHSTEMCSRDWVIAISPNGIVRSMALGASLQVEMGSVEKRTREWNAVGAMPERRKIVRGIVEGEVMEGSRRRRTRWLEVVVELGRV